MKKIFTVAVLLFTPFVSHADSWSLGTGFATYDVVVDSGIGDIEFSSENVLLEAGYTKRLGDKFSVSLEYSMLMEDDAAESSTNGTYFDVLDDEVIEQGKDEYSIAIGYRLNSNLSLNAGYFSGGIESTVGYSGNDYSFEQDFSGFFVGGAYVKKISSGTYGFVSVAYLDADVDVEESKNGTLLYDSEADGDGTKFEIGVNFVLGSSGSLMVSYENKSYEYEDYGWEYEEDHNALNLKFQGSL
jgi:hypothetical protein